MYIEQLKDNATADWRLILIIQVLWQICLPEVLLIFAFCFSMEKIQIKEGVG